jgi:hypothetical protein
MTQDQYGQARDSGYVVSGQAVGDEQTEEFDDGQEKKMTTFQKVASALRGDRPDRDTPDQDVRENEGTYGQTPAGPDDLADPHGMATGQTAQDTFTPGTGTPGTGTPDTFTPDTGAHETAGQETGAFDAKDPSVGVRDPDRMSPEGPATGTDTARGDYWDTPDTRGTVQDHADAVISPDTTAADADADRLGQHDAVNAQDPTVTQPDVYETGASPDAMDADAATTGTMHADATNADAATTGAVNPDAVNTGPVTTGDATAGAMTTGAMTTGAGATAAYPQDGAATIPDVPVTDTPAGVAETEAAGTAGRHAAAPATELHPGEAPEELHPGEAAGSLDDLGDLAYGKLIPDAADFTAQWQQVQFKFVDDPQASVTEAAAIVEQVTAKMEAAIQERQRAIAERQQAIAEQQRSLRDRWGADAQADTETLRATLRMYKAFLDQLVGPKA